MSGDGTAKRLSALQDRLGHRFADAALLTQALKHASGQQDRLNSNERLEFLGDRVLGLAVSALLYERFPDETEGELGYRFTALVRKETLAAVAGDLDLAPCLNLSPGETASGGRANPSILADACEALIGALFLDAGFEAAAAFVRRHWAPLADAHTGPLKDAKTRLQERCQKAGLPLPAYGVTDQTGPDHAPTFTVTVTVEDRPAQAGTGGTKQEAEQAAATAMLDAWKKG
ncbi:MAG: ribonuclease III [Rhodospirillales bacterium CG15_BIG_FIL_POST_REV_8_21_14_020_66_15]|nr:MAG: ribonuclease III [Rhodospirillales bacterium CG15_BIG_FIL_POST_REV_8_21_14_020_66_15]